MKASGGRPTYNVPLGQRNPPLTSAALILCRSRAQVSLSTLWDAADWASPVIFSLQLLEMWLNSRNAHERERAMWCATGVLAFTVNMNNFQVSGHLPQSLPSPLPLSPTSSHRSPGLGHSASRSAPTSSCASHLVLSFLPPSSLPPPHLLCRLSPSANSMSLHMLQSPFPSPSSHCTLTVARHRARC